MEINSRLPLAIVAAGSMLALSAACSGLPGTAPASAPESQRVAVGYGTQDRDNVTGAISSVTEEDFDNMPVSRIEDMLQDHVPGLQVSTLPNGELSIRIRGTRSLLGNNEPLVVIDGMPLTTRSSSALRMLAPQNIARIDVLKDAGSTAVYGSRGANGVILITTTRGR